MPLSTCVSREENLSALKSQEKSGKIVAEVEGLTKSFGDRVLVKDLNFRLMRGDRLA